MRSEQWQLRFDRRNQEAHPLLTADRQKHVEIVVGVSGRHHESFVGDLSTLNQMLISQIESISFYKAPEAMIKYGTNRTGGVITVTTKKQTR